MTTVLFAAGGTGGHIMPAISVARAVQRKTKRCEIVFVGVGRDLEQKLVSEAGFSLEVIPLAPFLGGGWRGKLRFLLSLPRAFYVGMKIFSRYHPKFVFGFGGYPSVVPVILAWCNGVPSALHEQNAQMGMANRVLARLTARVFAPPGATGIPDRVKVTETLMPVREAFYEVRPYALPLPGEGTRVLVLGGSQGARSVNDLILELYDVFKAHGAQIVHQTGSADAERMMKAYEERGAHDVRVVPFISDMASALAEAHLVISRAGAMAVAEITATARPAIYIPLSIAAAHQRANVQIVADLRGAFVVEQNETVRSALRVALAALLSDPLALRDMSVQLQHIGDGQACKPSDVLAEEVLLAISRMP
ncbi:MAG: UDP-N-acetylglucosamine--N-acetylmuramyl-(pentapeptide) pyrophosphoryl-undecaprenol N-acetylglucosamine transferase [Deltaproteobacteria bacterium]|nr:UDP-N-acetylglucosamine--N-acetylmuramyl-(pentapeptide) pyrophosphoryl-undecaprenol N-acetylglucosamine transferase [Deltaproteobacteria bacterium]